MPSLSQLWHWCWFASTGLYLVLFALLIRSGLYRIVPIFTLLVSCEAAGSTTLIVMNYLPSVTGDQYWFVYAVIFAIKSILSFGVVYEIFRHIFRDYPALTELSTRMFRWATIILIFFAITLAWLVPAGGEGHLMGSFYIVGRTFEVVLCGLVLFLMLFSKSLGLSWRTYIFGIALGLGIMASGNLAAYAIRSQIEPIARTFTTDILDLICESTNLLGVAVWVGYVFAHQAEDTTPISKLPTHDLETWNQELRRLLNPKSDHSF